MYRITADKVEELRADGYDLWTISLWEEWLAKQPLLDVAIENLRQAFDGVILGPGIGLLEADAMDAYDCGREEREDDERERWQDIAVEQLNACYAAPSYLDAVGFKFHLPAFLIADLNDQLQNGYDFVHRLIEMHPRNTDWIQFLTNAQRQAITGILEIVRHHPDYFSETDRFQLAIDRISGSNPNSEQ